MRCFGRQCRGQGKVFVKLVRHTETQLLEVGSSIAALAQEAHAGLQQAPQLSESTRERLASDLRTAQEAHQQISTQSRRLTHGKRLRHCKIVNAYDPTIAPILKGKSNCPAQFGRKPGLISEPTAGFIFAIVRPGGQSERCQLCLAPARQGPKRHRPGQAGPRRPQSIRSLVISGSMTRPCARRSMPEGFSASASPRQWPPSTRAQPRRDSGPAQRGGLEPEADPAPGAAGLCLWLQPPGGGKSHRQFARPRCRARFATKGRRAPWCNWA